MARLTFLAVLAGSLAATGCGDPLGFGGAPTPLARISVEANGTPPSNARLRVALVWGAQWLPELFCVLPAESPAAAEVVAAGCPDTFGFVPSRVAADVAVTIGTPAELDLFDLPSADVMVGDVTARVAYGDLVLYDDRNGDGTLNLRNTQRQPNDNDGGVDFPDAGFGPPIINRNSDVIYGASFVSMTLPDQRLAYREGDFNAGAAFYPRMGCAPPPKGFSIVAAGGFSGASALAAILAGQLPPEDPATCAEAGLADETVDLTIVDPATVEAVGCTRRNGNGVARYREPDDQLNLTGRTWACAGLPLLPGDVDTGVRQLVVASPADTICRSLTHYTLRGCDNDPNCATPDWDLTANPPSDWPCQ